MCKPRDKPYLVESPVTDNAIPILSGTVRDQRQSISVSLPNENISNCVHKFVSYFDCVVLISSTDTSYNKWTYFDLSIEKNDVDDALLETTTEFSEEPSVVHPSS